MPTVGVDEQNGRLHTLKGTFIHVDLASKHSYSGMPAMGFPINTTGSLLFFSLAPCTFNKYVVVVLQPLQDRHNFVIRQPHCLD